MHQYILVLLTTWTYVNNGAADTKKSVKSENSQDFSVFSSIAVQLTKLHEYSGATLSLAPINWCFASCAISIGKSASTLNRMVQQ
jgi:hypothetical protein